MGSTLQGCLIVFLIPVTLVGMVFLALYKGRRPVLWCCLAAIVMGPVFITIYSYSFYGLELRINPLLITSLWSFACILIISIMANLKKQRLKYDQLAKRIEKLEQITGLAPEVTKKLPDGKQNWDSLVSKLDIDRSIAESVGQS